MTTGRKPGSVVPANSSRRNRVHSRGSVRLPAALGALMLAAACATDAASQEVEVAAALQYSVLTKVLAFDRSLVSRVGAELVIGVVYQSGYPLSRDFARSMAVVWRDTAVRTIEGIPIRYVEIELTDVEELPRTLRAHGVDLLVVAPVRAVSIVAVLSQARNAGAMTFAGAAGNVDDGAAVGVAMRGGRPRIRINLTSARLEGFDFDANLLKLADVVR